MSCHLIPVSESGLHSLDAFCLCEPELIEEENKGPVVEMYGEMAYEHKPFNPLITKDESYEICNVAN